MAQINIGSATFVAFLIPILPPFVTDVERDLSFGTVKFLYVSTHFLFRFVGRLPGGVVFARSVAIVDIFHKICSRTHEQGKIIMWIIHCVG